jgi:hypothetical protein
MNETHTGGGGDKASPNGGKGKVIRFAADTTKGSAMTSTFKRGSTISNDKRTKAILTDEHEQT